MKQRQRQKEVFPMVATLKLIKRLATALQSASCTADSLEGPEKAIPSLAETPFETDSTLYPSHFLNMTACHWDPVFFLNTARTPTEL